MLEAVGYFKHSGMIWVRLVFDDFTGLLELQVWPNCGSGRHSLAASSVIGNQLGALTVLVVSLNPSMTRLLRSVCVASPFPMNSFADLDDLDAIKSAVWMRRQRYM